MDIHELVFANQVFQDTAHSGRAKQVKKKKKKKPKYRLNEISALGLSPEEQVFMILEHPELRQRFPQRVQQMDRDQLLHALRSFAPEPGAQQVANLLADSGRSQAPRNKVEAMFRSHTDEDSGNESQDPPPRRSGRQRTVTERARQSGMPIAQFNHKGQPISPIAAVPPPRDDDPYLSSAEPSDDEDEQSREIQEWSARKSKANMARSQRDVESVVDDALEESLEAFHSFLDVAEQSGFENRGT